MQSLLTIVKIPKSSFYRPSILRIAAMWLATIFCAMLLASDASFFTLAASAATANAQGMQPEMKTKKPQTSEHKAVLILSGSQYGLPVTDNMFQNPLVSPGILGVQHGAAFGGAVGILAFSFMIFYIAFHFFTINIWKYR